MAHFYSPSKCLLGIGFFKWCMFVMYMKMFNHQVVKLQQSSSSLASSQLQPIQNPASRPVS